MRQSHQATTGSTQAVPRTLSSRSTFCCVFSSECWLSVSSITLRCFPLPLRLEKVFVGEMKKKHISNNSTNVQLVFFPFMKEGQRRSVNMKNTKIERTFDGSTSGQPSALCQCAIMCGLGFLGCGSRVSDFKSCPGDLSLPSTFPQGTHLLTNSVTLNTDGHPARLWETRRHPKAPNSFPAGLQTTRWKTSWYGNVTLCNVGPHRQVHRMTVSGPSLAARTARHRTTQRPGTAFAGRKRPRTSTWSADLSRNTEKTSEPPWVFLTRAPRLQEFAQRTSPRPDVRVVYLQSLGSCGRDGKSSSRGLVALYTQRQELQSSPGCCSFEAARMHYVLLATSCAAQPYHTCTPTRNTWLARMRETSPSKSWAAPRRPTNALSIQTS